MMCPSSPTCTIYAASRTGGLWKTVNNGITWQNKSIDAGQYS
jgi:hypothetical protein